MTLFVTLFIAGVLTILLPCILPLIPIVLGVSIAGRSKWRPLLTIAGMVVSFVGFTFLLFVALSQFVELADYLRLATYYVLLLFGLGFLTHRRGITWTGAALGAFIFVDKGWMSVIVAAALGVVAMELGGRVASSIQSFGGSLQTGARDTFGQDNPVTAFLIGLTLGLVWVPCAGPALSFAFTLVRDEPGLQALLLLTAYGLGTALPLLLIGYGGQAAVHSVRTLNRYSGRIKQIAGLLLILSAVAFRLNWFTSLQTWFVNATPFGTIGTDIELKLFGERVGEDVMPTDMNLRSPETMPGAERSGLPVLGTAPEFAGLGTWHNAEPFTMEALRGKVVLVDFWTYSCINCIRTLPYIQGYWEKYGKTGADGNIDLENTPFVLIGVHTPEFVFEKSQENVADAIERHGLTYPSAQDNDYRTWRAFDNHYWPAKYLIDAQGRIRYRHFGEGEYAETDEAIASLLAEIGVESGDEPVVTQDAGRRRDQTPETYIGERSWSAFANAKGRPMPGDTFSYEAPEEIDLHTYALTGDWLLSDNGEYQKLQSIAGEIRLRFLGSEVNLVLGHEESERSIDAEVFIDGTRTTGFTVNRYDLYPLFKGEYGEHELVLRFDGAGVEAYAFTFGSR